LFGSFFKKSGPLSPFERQWEVYKFTPMPFPLILVALFTLEPYSEKEWRFGEGINLSLVLSSSRGDILNLNLFGLILSACLTYVSVVLMV
jgi:hypothetical protein